MDAFYEILGQQHKPYTVIADGAALVFLDACYFASGAHYQPGDSGWTDTYYPHTDVLRNTLSELRCPVSVFLHQNVDPNIREDHRLSNDMDLRRIFEESGVVRNVICGHYHPGMESDLNGVHYLTLPALCERETTAAIRILELP